MLNNECKVCYLKRAFLTSEKTTELYNIINTTDFSKTKKSIVEEAYENYNKNLSYQNEQLELKRKRLFPIITKADIMKHMKNCPKPPNEIMRSELNFLFKRSCNMKKNFKKIESDIDEIENKARTNVRINGNVNGNGNANENANGNANGNGNGNGNANGNGNGNVNGINGINENDDNNEDNMNDDNNNSKNDEILYDKFEKWRLLLLDYSLIINNELKIASYLHKNGIN